MQQAVYAMTVELILRIFSKIGSPPRLLYIMTMELTFEKFTEYEERIRTSCAQLLAGEKVQHTATHCNTLQHTATHCNKLQHTATHCNTLQYTSRLCLPSLYSVFYIYGYVRTLCALTNSCSRYL